jgi:hypothetical protein
MHVVLGFDPDKAIPASGDRRDAPSFMTTKKEAPPKGRFLLFAECYTVKEGSINLSRH